MAAYLTFLVDLEKEGDDRIVAGSVRFTPDPSRIPEDAFQWKVTCDARGLVVVRGNVGSVRVAVIATAKWDGTLFDKRQRDSTPTRFQWKLVETALAAASAMRKADPTPYDDSLFDEISARDAEALGVPPDELPSMLGKGELRRERAKPAAKPQRLWLSIIGLAGLVAASLVAIFVICREPAGSRPSSRPARAETPPAPMRPPPRPSPAWVTWAEVSAGPQTTIEQAEKEPAEEKGKRLCVEGTIENITRADRGTLRLYRGSIQTPSGDHVTFVVGGTTGDLVKRSSVKMCGVVTGFADGSVVAEGLFDLPENRNPIVEKDH